MEEESYLKMCRLCLTKPEGEPNWLVNQKIKDEFYEALDVEVLLFSKFFFFLDY